MESDVREALRNLTAAFESHLEAVIGRRGSDDPAVDDTYETLAEAFERYEDLLDIEYGEELPLVIEEDEDDDLDESEPVDPDEIEDVDEEDEDDEHHERHGDVDDLEEFDLRDDER